MAQLAHYAESFARLSGQSFRLVQADNGTGQAQHCPSITKWRGRFKDGVGKWWTLESCDGHRADLDSVHRIVATPHGIAQEARNRPFWTWSFLAEARPLY